MEGSRAAGRGSDLRFVVAVTAIIGIVALAFGAFVHVPHWRFERSLRIGMLKTEVEQSVGTPDAILIAGDVLEGWGNAKRCKVTAETWVYFIVPRSQHRMLLEFNGDALSSDLASTLLASGTRSFASRS
jgi:hypothetical protein